MKCSICGHEIRKDRLKIRGKYKLYYKEPGKLFWKKRELCENCCIYMLVQRYKKGTTNGDMFEVIFPRIVKAKNQLEKANNRKLDVIPIQFNKLWWDAPYEGVAEALENYYKAMDETIKKW